jgi:hypothetical protein
MEAHANWQGTILTVLHWSSGRGVGPGLSVSGSIEEPNSGKTPGGLSRGFMESSWVESPTTSAHP